MTFYPCMHILPCFPQITGVLPCPSSPRAASLAPHFICHIVSSAVYLVLIIFVNHTLHIITLVVGCRLSVVGKKCNIALRYKNLIEVEEIEKELEEEEDEDPVIQMRKIK